MARRVYDVDFHAVVRNSCILGKDSDSSLPLDRAGVHDTLTHFLIFTKYAALTEHAVYEGGLAMIYMGDNSYIANVFSFHYTHRITS